MKKTDNPVPLLLLFLLITAGTEAYALDLTEITTKLSETFSSLTGENEGTTAYRSLLIPSGGRAESLGTAYTGLSDDISCLEYNPAASSLLEQTETAVFHNAWIADSAMETLAGTVRVNNAGFGAEIKCFYVPFSEYNIFGERVAGSYYTETTAILNASYNFLAGYNFKGIAVGVNAKAAWRGVPDYTDNDTDAIISGSGLEQSGLAFAGDLGVMMRFNAGKLYASREPNLRIGLNLLNAGAALTGFGSSEGIRPDDPLPTSAAIGVSYRLIKPLLLTAEFRQPFNLQDFTEYQMWSAGTGISVQITNFFGVLGGFLIKGGNPRISFGSEFEILKKVQMNVNYTFDLTSSLNPVNHISLSAKIKLGDNGRAEKQKLIDGYYNDGLASFSKGDFAAAIDSWQKVLQLDKLYDPAKEGIKSAQNQILLFRRIRDAQFLN
ncbi:MAG TPA: hypothetical protein DCL73_16250 [Treponema sp.]|nr:hypothetical protein [Treponema sp.]